jgi:hypothetical protein
MLTGKISSEIFSDLSQLREKSGSPVTHKNSINKQQLKSGKNP